MILLRVRLDDEAPAQADDHGQLLIEILREVHGHWASEARAGTSSAQMSSPPKTLRIW